MRPGEEHVIPCVANREDTLTITLDADGVLWFRSKNRDGLVTTDHYLNHDTARQLFALLGNYLHSWPAP